MCREEQTQMNNVFDNSIRYASKCNYCITKVYSNDLEVYKFRAIARKVFPKNSKFSKDFLNTQKSCSPISNYRSFDWEMGCCRHPPTTIFPHKIYLEEYLEERRLGITGGCCRSPTS